MSDPLKGGTSEITLKRTSCVINVGKRPKTHIYIYNDPTGDAAIKEAEVLNFSDI